MHNKCFGHNVDSPGNINIVPLPGRDNIRKALCHLLCTRVPKYVRILSLNINDVNICDYKLSERLKYLLVKGTRVTIILGKEPKKRKVRRMLEQLSDRGARIHICKRLHAKLVLIEFFTPVKLILVMSANLTRSGLYKNIEVGVMIYDSSGKFYNEFKGFIFRILSSARRWI